MFVSRLEIQLTPVVVEVLEGVPDDAFGEDNLVVEGARNSTSRLFFESVPLFCRMNITRFSAKRPGISTAARRERVDPNVVVRVGSPGGHGALNARLTFSAVAWGASPSNVFIGSGVLKQAQAIGGREEAIARFGRI